jgi:DNA-binding NtrC family response regulator
MVRRSAPSARRKVDVRVIAATHRDLEAMVKAGRSARTSTTASTSSRSGPAAPRARERHPAPRAALLRGTAARGPHGHEARRWRSSRVPWPGNVRQLENEIRRAFVLSRRRIDTSSSPPRWPARRGRVARRPQRARQASTRSRPSSSASAPCERTRGNQTQRREAPRPLALRPPEDDEAPRHQGGLAAC